MWYKIISTEDARTLQEEVNMFIEERASFKETWVPAGGVAVTLRTNGSSNYKNNADQVLYQALMKVS